MVGYHHLGNFQGSRKIIPPLNKLSIQYSFMGNPTDRGTWWAIVREVTRVRHDLAAKQVKVQVAQSCPALCDPVDYTVHGILQTRILEGVAFPFSRGSSQSRDGTEVSPICRQILYQLSHKESPRITGVGSLSFLQWIFLTQESNQGLLHCRWILYQLSYQVNITIYFI